jgi:hypothetical protein
MTFARNTSSHSALKQSVRLLLGLYLTLVVTGRSFAQYGGGSMGGGTGSNGPGYVPPKGGYGSGAAVGIGVGAAAGAGLLFLALHHYGAISGCVRPTTDGLSVVDDKKNKTYLLVPGGVDLKPGERVELKGKKSTSKDGVESFLAKKLSKNLGSCSVESAQSTASK